MVDCNRPADVFTVGMGDRVQNILKLFSVPPELKWFFIRKTSCFHMKTIA